MMIKDRGGTYLVIDTPSRGWTRNDAAALGSEITEKSCFSLSPWHQNTHIQLRDDCMTPSVPPR